MVSGTWVQSPPGTYIFHSKFSVSKFASTKYFHQLVTNPGLPPVIILVLINTAMMLYTLYQNSYFFGFLCRDFCYMSLAILVMCLNYYFFGFFCRHLCYMTLAILLMCLKALSRIMLKCNRKRKLG